MRTSIRSGMLAVLALSAMAASPPVAQSEPRGHPTALAGGPPVAAVTMAVTTLAAAPSIDSLAFPMFVGLDAPVLVIRADAVVARNRHEAIARITARSANRSIGATRANALQDRYTMRYTMRSTRANIASLASLENTSSRTCRAALDTTITTSAHWRTPSRSTSFLSLHEMADTSRTAPAVAAVIRQRTSPPVTSAVPRSCRTAAPVLGQSAFPLPN